MRELQINETELSIEDFEREALIEILCELLPFHMISKRPAENSSVYDPYLKTSITGEEWDKEYKSYEKFINDSIVYKELVREALKRNNNNERSEFI